jgi:uncharacterized membrane protein
VAPSGRGLALGLGLGGLVGLLASAALLIERFLVLQDPAHVPSCTVDAVLSCTAVMASEQAALFGFPNPVLGVAAFPMVLVTGVALLAGARFARWYWASLQVGVTLGVVLVAWLIWQSVFAIGALCPYCMLVWAVTVPTFWFVTLRNARAGVFGAGVAASRTTTTLTEWAAPVLLVAFLAVVGLLGVEFREHWAQLAGR